MRKLPTSIQILGNAITVEHVDNMSLVGDRYGDWNISKNLIRVQSTGFEVPNDVCFAAFQHEVVHAILDFTGHSELSADESFVERLGQAFNHAEQSRKYAQN